MFMLLQVYPDGVSLHRDLVPPEHRAKPRLRMGSYSFEDLEEQPRPRLFTAHSRVANLPRELRDRGRLVIMTRDPKDALGMHAQSCEQRPIIV